MNLIDLSNWFRKSRRSDCSNLKRFRISIECLQNVFKLWRESQLKELLRMKGFGKKSNLKFYMIKFEIFFINTKSYESTLFDLILTKRRSFAVRNDFTLRLKTNKNNLNPNQNPLKKNPWCINLEHQILITILTGRSPWVKLISLGEKLSLETSALLTATKSTKLWSLMSLSLTNMWEENLSWLTETWSRIILDTQTLNTGSTKLLM